MKYFNLLLFFLLISSLGHAPAPDLLTSVNYDELTTAFSPLIEATSTPLYIQARKPGTVTYRNPIMRLFPTPPTPIIYKLDYNGFVIDSVDLTDEFPTCWGSVNFEIFNDTLNVLAQLGEDSSPEAYRSLLVRLDTNLNVIDFTTTQPQGILREDIPITWTGTFVSNGLAISTEQTVFFNTDIGFMDNLAEITSWGIDQQQQSKETADPIELPFYTALIKSKDSFSFALGDNSVGFIDNESLESTVTPLSLEFENTRLFSASEGRYLSASGAILNDTFYAVSGAKEFGDPPNSSSLFSVLLAHKWSKNGELIGLSNLVDTVVRSTSLQGEYYESVWGNDGLISDNQSHFYAINFRPNDQSTVTNYLTCFNKELEVVWQREWITEFNEYSSAELELTPDKKNLILIASENGIGGGFNTSRILLYYINPQNGDLVSVVNPQAGPILEDLVYPNPAHNNLYLSAAAMATGKVNQLMLYAVKGGAVILVDLQSNGASLDNVPVGSYIAVARNTGGQMIGRQRIMVH